MSRAAGGSTTMWVEGRGQVPGQLVVVSGPSGCGKSTVIRRALERPGLKVRLSVSATTRPIRAGERGGVDYVYLDHATFQSSVGRDEFLEWAEYNDHLYGTPAGPVYEALAAGQSVLLEIEVQGALQVRQHAPSALFVFVRTPTFRALEERLRGRGTETEDAILRRLRKGREELAEAHWYDVQLVNDELDRCVDDFVKVLESNGCGG
jgi:guanylate kinase